MHSAETVRQAIALREAGHTVREVATILDIPSSTIRTWGHRGFQAVLASSHRGRAGHGEQEQCPILAELPARPYAYFLGQYLGDGNIVEARRQVFRCCITCCAAYPGIIDECVESMKDILPGNRVGRRARPGAVDVNAYSRHWPCLVPQHGPGPKHKRRIELVEWQRSIVMTAHPDAFLRGLVHSDGCRSMNTVRSPAGRRYSYPRYIFSNRSEEIRGLFTEACERLGIASRQMGVFAISVARRKSVEKMDRIIGPKL